MITVVASLQSTSPYSPSYFLQSPQDPGETGREYELRVWRERIHRDKQGHVVIPSNQLSRALKTAASYLNIKIPGERNRTFTKHFDSGVRVLRALPLPLKVEDVEGEWLMLHAQPSSTSQGKVPKYMPRIDHWEGEVTYLVFDPKITKDVFYQVLVYSGSQIGIGRWRSSNKGEYGNYSVEKFTWNTE